MTLELDGTLATFTDDTVLYDAPGLETAVADPTDNAHLSKLLQAVALRNTAAFDELHQLSRPWMLRAAIKILRSSALGEEAVQEVMLKIWQRASNFDPARGTARAWLHSVLRNHALDIARARRPQEISFDNLETSLLDRFVADEDPSADADQSMCMQQVASAMDSLPAPMRSSVWLSCYHGYSHSEIAEQLDAPIGTVKAWVRRGLQRLRVETAAYA